MADEEDGQQTGNGAGISPEGLAPDSQWRVGLEGGASCRCASSGRSTPCLLIDKAACMDALGNTGRLHAWQPTHEPGGTVPSTVPTFLGDHVWRRRRGAKRIAGIMFYQLQTLVSQASALSYTGGHTTGRAVRCGPQVSPMAHGPWRA